MVNSMVSLKKIFYSHVMEVMTCCFNTFKGYLGEIEEPPTPNLTDN